MTEFSPNRRRFMAAVAAAFCCRSKARYHEGTISDVVILPTAIQFDGTRDFVTFEEIRNAQQPAI